MKTIWKYKLHGDVNFALPLPQGAKILKIHLQGDELILWALVDTANILETRFFRIISTGWDIQGIEKLRYIDTYFEYNESLVWHLFELLE